MNRYQYKVVIYDINEEHYATIMTFSFLEPSELHAQYEHEITTGGLGIYANRCSVTKLATEKTVQAITVPEMDYPEFLKVQAS